MPQVSNVTSCCLFNDETGVPKVEVTCDLRESEHTVILHPERLQNLGVVCVWRVYSMLE